MKKILFLIAGLGYFTVYAQNFQWSNHIGSEGDIYPHSDHVLKSQFDEEGNNYMLIFFASSANPKIGDRVINLPEDYLNPFLLLAKFDCSGLLQWYRTIVSYNYDLNLQWPFPVGPEYGIMAMHNDKIVCACTSDGNRMYVRDEEGNDIVFSQNMYPANVQGWFDLIVQFDNAGNLIWGHCCETIGPEDAPVLSYFPFPHGIQYDEEGNIHELLSLEGTLDGYNYYYDLNCCGHPLVEGIELYVRKYSPEGVLLTVTPVPVGKNLIYKQNGFHYFQGQYLLVGSAFINSFPTGYLMVNGDTVWLGNTAVSACMAAIDTSGQFLWFRQIGEQAGVNGIDMDNAGDIYLAGQFWGRFGNDTIELIWGQNLLKPATSFAKIDHTNGDVLYLKSILTSNNGSIGAIQVMDNQLIALGACVGGAKACFDSITYLNSVPRYCPYIAIFDEAAMQFTCVDRIDTNDTSPHGASGISKIAVDKDNNLMVCGGFAIDSITIGDSTYYNFGYGGSADIWIGRYGWPCGESAQWPTGIAEPPPPTATLENRLLLYPNPTRNQLKITNYELQEGDKIEIYNMLGQLQSSMLPAQLSTIDVGYLPAGMYMVRVGRMVGKFVKE